MKTSGEIKRLERIAENTLNERESKAAMLELRRINTSYHWCAEWDYMVICDRHPEYDVCLCHFPGKTKSTKELLYNVVGAIEGILTSDKFKKDYPSTSIELQSIIDDIKKHQPYDSNNT